MNEYEKYALQCIPDLSVPLMPNETPYGVADALIAQFPTEADGLDKDRARRALIERVQQRPTARYYRIERRLRGEENWSPYAAAGFDNAFDDQASAEREADALADDRVETRVVLFETENLFGRLRKQRLID